MLRIASLLAVALALPSASASAQQDFYKGKQVNWILSAGEGGGYSSYARAFAPFFEKAIPGNPNIVIQNMPGAGGIRAMMYFANVAPKDGTTIGMVHSSVPFAPLYGTKGANFDPRQMNWIGSISRATAICVAWHTSGVQDWKDLFDKEYIVGGTGAGSQMETLPALLNKLYAVGGILARSSPRVALGKHGFRRGEVGSVFCKGIGEALKFRYFLEASKHGLKRLHLLHRVAEVFDLPRSLVSLQTLKKLLRLVDGSNQSGDFVLRQEALPPEGDAVAELLFRKHQFLHPLHHLRIELDDRLRVVLRHLYGESRGESDEFKHRLDRRFFGQIFF